MSGLLGIFNFAVFEIGVFDVLVPPRVIFRVHHDNRSFVIPRERRAFEVSADLRSFIVPREARSFRVASDRGRPNLSEETTP